MKQKKLKTVNNTSHARETRIAILIVTLFSLFYLWLKRSEFFSFTQYGYLGIFLLNFISSSTVIMPFPGIATVFLGGAILRPIWVGIISGLGATLGELFGYFIGFGTRGLFKTIEKENYWLKKVERYFHRTGFVTIFIFSALPLPVFDVIGILAGSLNYSLWKFFTAAFLGRVLRNFLIALAGAKVLPM